jgi:hypothetical protein
MTTYWSWNLPNQPGNCLIRNVLPPTDFSPGCTLPKLASKELYGIALQKHKHALNHAFSKAHIPHSHHGLFMAMAMAETNTMTPGERDITKDKRSDGSENVTIFNLNVDLLKTYLQYPGNPQELSPLENLPEVLKLLELGIKYFGGQEQGVLRLLHFVRGGRSGFFAPETPEFKIPQYLNGIATILRKLDQEPDLMKDPRRVEIDIEHIDTGQATAAQSGH